MDASNNVLDYYNRNQQLIEYSPSNLWSYALFRFNFWNVNIIQLNKINISSSKICVMIPIVMYIYYILLYCSHVITQCSCVTAHRSLLMFEFPSHPTCTPKIYSISCLTNSSNSIANAAILKHWELNKRIRKQTHVVKACCTTYFFPKPSSAIVNLHSKNLAPWCNDLKLNNVMHVCNENLCKIFFKP